MEPGAEKAPVAAGLAPETWTEVQVAEGRFFDDHWSEILAAGKLDLEIPPDTALFEQDLGRSLAYMLERLGDLQGQRVVDLGCGPGDFSIFVARHGAQVEAVDVAPAALEITRQRAAVNGVEALVRTHLMPAERLDFPAETFDWVLGFGVLHHTDLEVLGAELRRVLKPGGKALFREPLGANPVLEFARRHLPYRGKYHSQHERPLTYADIALLGSFFSTTEVREFYLLSSLSRLLGGEGGALFRFLWTIDGFLLRHLPLLRRFCRYVVVEYAL